MTEVAEITVKLPPMYPKQRAVFYDPARIVVCEATTKAGKTTGGLVWLMDHELFSKEAGQSIWTCPIHAQAIKVYERLVRQMTRIDPKRTIWDAHEQKRTVQLGKGRIVFFGSENYDSIYGSDYRAAVIDEASRQREEVWPAVRSTLTATRGQVRIIGNVKGRRNWAYRMARKAEQGDPDMAYFRLTAQDAVDSGVLAAEEIEEARRQLPEAVFRELYLAQASDDEGNPFGLTYIERQIAPLSSEPPVCFGVDLARAVDYTVVIGRDRHGRVCRFDRWQGLSWEATEQRILAIIGETRTLVDSTGVGDPIVERMSKSRPWVSGIKFTSSSKQDLMQGLAVAIQQGRAWFPDGPIRHELEAFEYEYRLNSVRYSAPEGMHDDCVVALALSQAAMVAVENFNPPMVDFIGAPSRGGWRDW